MIFRLIFVCGIFALLTACGSTKQPALTIDSLKDRVYTLKKGNLPEISKDEVVKKYRDFINYASGEPMYGNAYKRLADIELELAQDDINATKPDRVEVGRRKMQAAVRMYLAYLDTYPKRRGKDLILYQLAKAYDLAGDPLNSLLTLNQLATDFPDSRFYDEAQFRRGEIMFSLQKYPDAELAYGSIVQNIPDSSFYEQALYKYGWAQFKQNKYKNSLSTFLQMLDRKYQQGLLADTDIPDSTKLAEKELIEDTFRVTSLALTYQRGTETLRTYFSTNTKKPYDSLLYQKLGELYINKSRIKDGADVYIAYSNMYPKSALAPRFYQLAIDAYQKAGLFKLFINAKRNYVRRFGVNTPFWLAQGEQVLKEITPTLKTHIKELAMYYHAGARKSKKPTDYNSAAYWYGLFIKSFSTDAEAASINFLLAESLYDAGRYADALPEYEKTAYQYPLHKQSAVAAYAALITYKKLEPLSKGENRLKLQAQSIESALKYCKTFPQDKHVTTVLIATAEKLYTTNDFIRAIQTAQILLDQKPPAAKHQQQSAWTIIGHAQFEQALYDKSELAYISAIRLLSPKAKNRSALEQRLAASIYKQGEAQRKLGKLDIATTHFLRLRKAVPTSRFIAAAEYDAAAMLIQLERWSDAEKVLTKFRRSFPKQNKYTFGVSEKLALIYSKTGKKAQAAREIERLANSKKDNTYRRNMLLQAAGLYSESKLEKDAIRIYTQYVRQYPYPVEQAMEAQHELAEYYRKTNKPKDWSHWLNEQVKSDRKAGKNRTPRTRYLAANATLLLASPLHSAYSRTKLKIPLKKSLKRKKALMERALKAYKRALDYRVAEVTTTATFKIADIYQNLARSLLDSQRPKNLKPEELEQYNLLLEEQAYPFEEKAIGIHEANVKYATNGLYDDWIEKSLTALRKLHPIRYAKDERFEDYVESLF